MKIKKWANRLINLILLNLLDSLLFYDRIHVLISTVLLLHLLGVMHFLNKMLHVKLPILVSGICLWNLNPIHYVSHHSLTLRHLLVSISVIRVRLELRHQCSSKLKLLTWELFSLRWGRCRSHRVGLLSLERSLRWLLVCVEIEEIEIVFCFWLILGSRMVFQEIKVGPEFMENISRAMFGACVGTILVLSDDQVS